MSNPNPERDERVEMPEQLYIHPTSAEYHLNKWPLEESEYVGYVRFDIAATRMRDRCVEKVREMRDGWQQKLDQAEEYSAVETVMSSRTYASDQIITALQSLTLEGEQEK